MLVSFRNRTGKKTEVLIDGEFKGALYPGEIRRLGLEEDMDIRPAVYDEMMQEILLHRAKLRIMNILIKADKSEAELRKKLNENGYCEETIDAAVRYVRSFHYIDDLRTAENYIRTKMYTLSEREIRYHLEQKGIESEYIDLAYEQALEAEQVSEPELIAAEGFVRKKLGSRSSSIDELTNEEQQKLYSASYRKGFRQEFVRKALKNIMD